MPDHSTGRFSDDELNSLAVLMADHPEFAAKLADAITERLDEKYGWRQGELADGFEKLSQKTDQILAKLEDHDMRFDTLDHNFQMLGEKVDLTNSEVRKVNGRIDSIDRHLGINTDTKRSA